MLAFETMSKKLINDRERAVDESLAGLVSINSGLKLLEGHRVVLRADVQELVKQGKVKNYEFFCLCKLCHDSHNSTTTYQLGKLMSLANN